MNFYKNKYLYIKSKNSKDNKYPLVRNGQKDAIEFLRELLNDINIENKINIENYIYREINIIDKYQKELAIGFNKIRPKKQNSIIMQYFYIKLKYYL